MAGTSDPPGRQDSGGGPEVRWRALAFLALTLVFDDDVVLGLCSSPAASSPVGSFRQRRRVADHRRPDSASYAGRWSPASSISPTSSRRGMSSWAERSGLPPQRAAGLAGGAAVGMRCAFATGFFLAGVYPPALKLMATWFKKGRGVALGDPCGRDRPGTSDAPSHQWARRAGLARGDLHDLRP